MSEPADTEYVRAMVAGLGTSGPAMWAKLVAVATKTTLSIPEAFALYRGILIGEALDEEREAAERRTG